MAGNRWIALGAFLAAIAVSCGAIGAHVLKEVLEYPPAKLDTFEVGVRNRMYHAIALVLIGMLSARWTSRSLTIAAWLFVAGIVLFSGGIYAWVFSENKAFVQLVPFGGVSLIVGWLVLSVGALLAGKDKLAA